MEHTIRISVTDDILSGNLFNESGYNENKSADNLAALIEQEYTDIIESAYPDAEIEVDVESRHNVSGCSRGIYIDVEIDNEDDDDYDGPSSFEITHYLESALDSNEIWSDRWDEWAVSLTVDDLTDEDIEWDEDDGFSFPKWMTGEQLTEATKKYALLADYNRAYDLEITDISDTGYELYAHIRGLIDAGNMHFRLKNEGPYNPDNKKIILVNAICTTAQWHTGNWSRFPFVESEDTFDICKLLGIKYPWNWELQRKNRLHRTAYDWTQKAAPELPGLKNALSEIECKIRELQVEQSRLSERVTEESAKYAATKIRADEWEQKMLSK